MKSISPNTAVDPARSEASRRGWEKRRQTFGPSGFPASYLGRENRRESAFCEWAVRRARKANPDGDPDRFCIFKTAIEKWEVEPRREKALEASGVTVLANFIFLKQKTEYEIEQFLVLASDFC